MLFLSTGTEIQLHCDVRYQKEAMGVISNNQDLILRMDPESGLLTLVQEVMMVIMINTLLVTIVVILVSDVIIRKNWGARGLAATIIN